MYYGKCWLSAAVTSATVRPIASEMIQMEQVCAYRDRSSNLHQVLNLLLKLYWPEDLVVCEVSMM